VLTLRVQDESQSRGNGTSARLGSSGRDYSPNNRRFVHSPGPPLSAELLNIVTIAIPPFALLQKCFLYHSPLPFTCRTCTDFLFQVQRSSGQKHRRLPQFFRHILTRVAKTLYLFGNTGHSYTVQTEMVRTWERSMPRELGGDQQTTTTREI